MLRSLIPGALALTALLAAGPALAQDTAEAAETVTRVADETGFILNTFLFLFAGVLVMWMAAGFSMLESGLVRTKNTATICLKNVTLYALGGIMYYLVGYNLMYVDVTGWIGSLSLFYNPSSAELALLDGDESMLAAVLEGGYTIMSDWFFQMVFVATAASIVSGAVAERVKLGPFLVFVILLTGFLYPIQGSWTWGAGWLDAMGFSDYAGSTIVHSAGGWAALTGAIIIGARKGKYGPDGKVNPIPGANLPLATLGTLILWMGWFGFNGASALAMDSAAVMVEMSLVFANTNLAAAGGVVTAVVLTTLIYKKVDLTMALNGALAGLVSITAGPDVGNPLLAIIIGAVGGLIVVVTVPLLDRFKIDDVVGAVPVHLFAGIWGTLAVAIFGDADFFVQIIGILAIGGFMAVTSSIAWLAIKAVMGLRVSEEEEALGLDRSELGLEAYPEFAQGARSL
ncbi:ammonium transporter [Aquibaculum arenosum]|uniref:Ammonium transporter n=1 Tax=Aquibaculum arenosum TaxID=3032591 RepID=A0ABT5YL95_9PROT|nr:ammonium transporter [Fodinicurvata sp. CAU 1616]MDF2095717.1 ammonium transporter [Fodinicurvata sp. CAU 1616]